MMKLLDYEIKVEDLSCIEYSHCPRSEQSDERYRDAPVVYDNFMRIHMPASLFLRYRASREFKSIVSKKLAGDSPRTLVTRADALVNFLAFLAEKKTLLQHLSFEDIREYADDMAAGRFSIKNIGTSLAPSTILVRAQTAAMFGEFLNFIGVSPNFQLETLEISKRISGLIPAAILVFKRCREDSENILFIDASRDYEPGKNQNNLRTQDVNKIIDTLAGRQTIEKYSYLAPLSEIAENEYNLNIPRYVDTFEEEEEIDLMAVNAERVEIEKEIAELNAKMQGYLKELGYES